MHNDGPEQSPVGFYALCHLRGPPSSNCDKFLEDSAAMFETFELIEAGAGRRQQHGIAGLRPRARRVRPPRPASRIAISGTAPSQLRRDLGRRRADQQRRARFVRASGSRSTV